jgi:two-component system, NtrC family, sensor kinase
VKLRIALVSVVLSVTCTAVVWLTVQPTLQSLTMMLRLWQPDGELVHRASRVIPWLLAGDAVILWGLFWLVLFAVAGAPLARAEEVVRQIAEQQGDVAMTGGGPLAARLHVALKGLQRALGTEREKNRRQLEHLTATNERLQRLQAELVAADRMATVGKLAAGVAHEVGNPLAGILGYVSLLRMRSKDGSLGDVLDRVEHEVQRIDSIVRSLLELGRPSRGKAQPVDVKVAIDSAVRLVSVGPLFANIKVTVEAPDSLWMRAEMGPLSQVLINLLINAAQAMDRGTIFVRATSEPGRGIIRVEDEGPGLSPQVQARLFEPFFTTRPPGEGTGLGLAISKHLLTQFDGDLVAENRPSGGAAFIISLPAP